MPRDDEDLFWNALAATVVGLDRLPPERVNSATFLQVMGAVYRYNHQRRGRQGQRLTPEGSERWRVRFRDAIQAQQTQGPDVVSDFGWPDELEGLLALAPEKFP